MRPIFLYCVKRPSPNLLSSSSTSTSTSLSTSTSTVTIYFPQESCSNFEIKNNSTGESTCCPMRHQELRAMQAKFPVDQAKLQAELRETHAEILANKASFQ